MKKLKPKVLKTINLVSQVALIINMSMVGVFLVPERAGAVTPDPDFTSVTWSPYQIDGITVTDYEDGVCSLNDDSNGGTNVTPKNVDLASNAQVGPPCLNPGAEPTLQYGEDVDYFYFRIRLADTPLPPSGSQYDSYHWDVLMDVDGNGYSDYVLDLNGSAAYGGNGSNYKGVIGLYANNANSYTYNPANFLWKAQANNNSNVYTHVMATTQNSNQYWLDLALPKAASGLTSYDSLFASTSASNTNPLQKDWMASEGFFIELVKSKSVVNLTNPGATTVANPAKPGDTLRYTLSVSNSGNMTAPGFVIFDYVGDIVEYTTDPFNISDSGSYNSGTEEVVWPQQDIAPAATISETFDVTVNPMAQWPTQGDFQLDNVYGNDVIVPFCHLDITKQVDKTTASVGETLEYTLQYTNNGTANCTGTGAEIYDDLDPILTYNGIHTELVTGDLGGDGITFLGNFNGTDPVANAHVVSPGESGTIIFQAVIGTPIDCGDFDIPNQASIWSTQTGVIWSNIVNTHVTMVCEGSLKVIKHVDSGTATPDQWDFTVAGHGSQSPNPGENFVIFDDLLAGTYTATESALPDYHMVSTTCNNVAVTAGQQSVCEFHNTHDRGNLTIHKEVDVDGNGTIDLYDPAGWTWDLDYVNTNYNMGYTETVDTGSHHVKEDQHTNYHSDGWYCDDGTSGNGEELDVDVPTNGVSCTFTNTRDTATLTLVKHVINDDGGTLGVSDFPLFIDAQQVTSGVAETVLAGIQYTASETSHPDYQASVWSGDCAADGTITLQAGENKVCHITNDDKPATLTLIKHVINDDGGTKQVADFPLFVDTTQVTSGVAHNVAAGTYTASETEDPGYEASNWMGDCAADGTVTVQLGDHKVCEITNDDKPATLTLIKHVINDNGGTLGVSDFNLYVDTTQVTSGVAHNVTPGTYTASEDTSPSYSASAWSGDCGPDGVVSIQLGEHKVCEITNDDIAPQLTVIKHVINDDGGTAVAADFTMNVTGTNVSNPSFPGDESGTTVTLNAGSYSVDEVELPGYTKTLGSDCSGTIEVGIAKVCTITNDDQRATLTLIKTVINDNGGTKVVADFPLFIDATQVTSGAANPVVPGTYTASETEDPGYTASAWMGDCASDGTVSIALGEHKVCEITNDDEAPTITLIKSVTNDNGGNALPDDFLLTIGGNPATSGTTYNVDANTPYALDETQLAGYTFVSLTGDPKCPAALGGTATLDEGEDITCTITNDDIQPTLTLVKTVINDNGGTKVVADFPLYIDGTLVTSGVAEAVTANHQYTATEDEDLGYLASVWGTDCAADGTITLLPGENKVCTITNDDIAPELTVIKHVITDDGGTAVAADFTMNVTGT
ncbi:MAG: hypothetical protein ABIB97_04415, partial [Patescibacteria group bacterium]